MTGWQGFEIVCIEFADDADYDDVRSIERFGVKAPSLEMKRYDFLWWALQKKEYAYHARIDGEVLYPSPDMDGDRKFIRIHDEVSPDDPLLTLPSCDEFETEHKLDAIR